VCTFAHISVRYATRKRCACRTGVCVCVTCVSMCVRDAIRKCRARRTGVCVCVCICMLEMWLENAALAEYVWVCVCVCLCVSEMRFENATPAEQVCVCVCVCERECVCVHMKQRESRKDAVWEFCARSTGGLVSALFNWELYVNITYVYL